MANLTVRGFVLREVSVGDADRIINILSSELGLITASARGARRARSPLLLATQVFSFSEFELFAHKGHYTVNSAELAEPFMGLHQDLDRLVCASHLAEVLLDCTKDDVPQPELYRLWAYAAQALQSQPDPLLAVHIAQFRILAEIGFAPCLDRCVVCCDAITGGAWLSLQACGLVCRKASCRQPANAADARPISAGTLSCLRHCLEAPLARLFNVKLSPQVRQEFLQIADRYLTQQMEKHYTRLQMLDGLDSLAGKTKQDDPPDQAGQPNSGA